MKQRLVWHLELIEESWERRKERKEKKGKLTRVEEVEKEEEKTNKKRGAREKKGVGRSTGFWLVLFFRSIFFVWSKISFFFFEIEKKDW